MHVLAVRQCPQCVLRFGSSSELDQHVRLDHRPAAQEITGVDAADPLVATEEHPPTTSAPPESRFVVTAIVAGALIAVVAVISWHLAALTSLALGTAAALWVATRVGTTEER